MNRAKEVGSTWSMIRRFGRCLTNWPSSVAGTTLGRQNGQAVAEYYSRDRPVSCNPGQVDARHAHSRGRRIEWVLHDLAGPFDLIFLDADRPNYLAYLDPLLTLLRKGGLLVTDNVTSYAHEVEDFLRRLKADPALETVPVPLGNGEELTYRR